MPSDFVLETRSLVKEFKGFVAVNDVSLKVRRGHIHALIGPNGAGKTTVFNLLTKFLAPTRGSIVFNGADITPQRPAEVARRGIVRSFQISAVFPHLSVLENVRVALQRKLGTSFHFWRSPKTLEALRGRALEHLREVNLERHADRIAVELPYGSKRALEIATTLALEPELLLLDEPTQGMGHEDVDRVRDLIKKVSVGRTVLMVEHNMSVVAGISDMITVLARGSVLAEGPYAEVSKNPQVIEAYIGVGELMPPGTEVLRVTGLHAFYGESHILHGMDFIVRRGECATLLGRNGAGRTTTLKAILGLCGARSGSIIVNGREVIAMPPHRIARLGVGYCPEERGIYASLSTEENLMLPPQVASGGMSLDEIYTMFPNLKERRRSQGSRLSGGEQQMLAMARILRTGARLLLLDEISEGLAPVIVHKLAEVVGRLKEAGYTLVLAEQNFRFAAPLADRMFVVEHGRVVAEVGSGELAEKQALVDTYLGV